MHYPNPLKITLTGALIFLLFLTMTAQSRLHFEHLGTADGLSDNRVECIYQDQMGFMWFATDNGLNRYDGQQMEFIAYDSLHPERVVRQIVEDRQGNMWVNDWLNFYLYNPGRDDFETFTLLRDSVINAGQNHRFLIDQLTFWLYPDRHGNLWLGSYAFGVVRFDRERGKFILLAHEFNMNLDYEVRNYVTVIREDHYGNLWFSYPGGLRSWI